MGTGRSRSELEAQIAELRKPTAGLELEIAEGKSLQAARRDNGELYRDLVESTHDLVQSVATDGHLVFANRAWLETLGYTREELSHLTLADVIHPESLVHCQEVFAEVIAGKPVGYVEAKFLTKDGREILVEGSAIPRFHEGLVTATHGFFRDITHRTLVEKELRRSEEMYRSLLEQAPDAIFIAAPDLDFIDLNARACNLSGYAREQILQMSISDFLLPEDILTAPLKLKEMQDGRTVLVERRFRRKSEQLRALSARLQSAREEEGTRIAREIHDELGGALTGLKWDLEGIDKVLTGAGNGALVRTVREKIPDMTGLIGSTINIVRRISSDLRPGVLDDLGLGAAIEWQAQQFQSRTGIQCEYVTDTAVLDLNRERATVVFRILQEILTNVIRHSQATRVEIQLTEREGLLELRVSDNGRGITQDEKEGTHSLGLLGMRERALLVGGDVSVNGAAGMGTIVVARVPIASSDPGNAAHTK